MRLLLIPSAALLALAACAPAVPDSAPGDFEPYDIERRAQLDAQLEGRVDPATGRIEAPATVQSSGLGTSADGTDDIAAMAAAALDGGGTGASDGGAFSEPSVTGSVPGAVTNAAGISDENDFDAVSSQRSIQQDAARVAQNQAQYQEVAPTPIDSRPAGNSVNVVDYALSTTNQVGQPQYSRSAFASKAREQRNCAAYASADLAQEEFLASGGPERDRNGLDADGDGFACDWSPAPFRRARG